MREDALTSRQPRNFLTQIGTDATIAPGENEHQITCPWSILMLRASSFQKASVLDGDAGEVFQQTDKGWTAQWPQGTLVSIADGFVWREEWV